MRAVGVGMTPEQYQEECVRQARLIGGYYKTVPHHDVLEDRWQIFGQDHHAA